MVEKKDDLINPKSLDASRVVSAVDKTNSLNESSSTKIKNKAVGTKENEGVKVRMKKKFQKVVVGLMVPKKEF